MLLLVGQFLALKLSVAGHVARLSVFFGSGYLVVGCPFLCFVWVCLFVCLFPCGGALQCLGGVLTGFAIISLSRELVSLIWLCSCCRVAVDCSCKRSKMQWK